MTEPRTTLDALKQQVRTVLRGVALGQLDERVNLGATILTQAIAALNADDAQTKLALLTAWVARKDADTREWLQKHNPDCGCEAGEATLNLLDQIRSLLGVPLPDEGAPVEHRPSTAVDANAHGRPRSG